MELNKVQFKFYVGLLFICRIVTVVYGQVGSIKFKPPNLNDEEISSAYMPSRLKCDGCKIIAYKLTAEFNNAHEARKSPKNLPETEIIDLVDKVCADKYADYGVKEIDGKVQLSGPGLPEVQNVPGVMQGGGMWPTRLRKMCSNYIDEVGEEELYEAYVLNKDNFNEFLCKGPGARGYCNTKKKGKAGKKTEKKKEEL